MKLSNLSVIFIVLAIPLILILSYYISLQRDTINMQTSYNTKLLESTKEAIEAFEINTVEWNEAYSETADSKRRDVMASINTFTTALANNLGVSGTSKEYLLTHIPAVAFTLYDGFYIYSPSETKFTVKNKNGVTQFMSEDTAKSTIGGYSYQDDDNGKILYEASTSNYDGIYKYEDSYGNNVEKYFTLNPENALGTKDYQSQDYPHILKPFTVYSEAVTSGTNKMIINYTLDNYVTVYGVDQEDPEKYISKSGYLNVIKQDTNNAVFIPDENFNYGKKISEGSSDIDETTISTYNPIKNIEFSGKSLEPELLSENIAYKEEGTEEIKTGPFNYVYEAEKDTKIYYDKDTDKFFRLGSDLKRVYVENLPEPLYKKCLIPILSHGEKSYLKVFQSLSDSQWYIKNGDVYILISDGDMAKKWDELFYHNDYFTNPRFDYSAINYCVETYIFTNWVNSLNLEYIAEKIINEDGTITEITDTMVIDENNDPENNDSKFNQHKKEVIKQIVIDNLNQAITSYSKKTKEEYKLPMLKETEWDQVLSNVSIITFLQNIPIGLKYYNNYAIATSTFNKEYVDPNEIYIYDQDTSSDLIYHTPYCNKLITENNLIGYRSIDYMHKDYEKTATGETKYYFKHTDNSNSKQVNQSCYYCLVQRALYEESITDKKKDAYYTALARERYLQLDSITIDQADISVTKKVTKSDGTYADKVNYGDTVKYTIQITNNSSVNESINIVDWYYEDKIDIIDTNIIVKGKNLESQYYNSEGTLIEKVKYNGNDYNFMRWSNITIEPYETIEISYTAKLYGNIGELLTNYVGIFAYSINETKITQAETSSRIEKTVAVQSPENNTKNIFLVLDKSNSMDRFVYKEYNELLNIPISGVGKGVYPKTVRDFIESVENRGSNITGAVLFAASNEYVSVNDLKNNYNIWNTDLGTWYGHALENAKNYVSNGDILVFFTDGKPTYDLVVEVPYSWGTPPWPKIIQQSKEIRDKGVTIYTVGYGTSDNLQGLKEVIASDEEKAFYGNSITELFDHVLDEIFETLTGIPDFYESNLGVIYNLQYVNRIKDIQIGGVSLVNYENYILDKDETNPENVTGTLSLKDIEGIQGDEEIKIIYE